MCTVIGEPDVGFPIAGFAPPVTHTSPLSHVGT